MNHPDQNKRNQQRCPKCRRIVGCDVNGRKHHCDCVTPLEACELVERAWAGEEGIDMATAVDACLLAIKYNS